MYTKTVWVEGGEPAISAQNLNKIEAGIYDAHEGIYNYLPMRGSNPAFMINASVVNRWIETADSSANGAIVDYYRFKHKAQYIYFVVSISAQTAGQQARAIVTTSTNDTDTWLANATSTNALASEEIKTLKVDLGDPVGDMKGLYLRLKTNTSTSKAYIRVLDVYQSKD